MLVMFMFHATFRNLLPAASLLLVAGRAVGEMPDVPDADESICIISGTATCLLEGRTCAMSDCATAIVPRGRVHYFINESSTAMEMIRGYAGPMPERVVADAAGSAREGNPWK
jgi:mannose-6-phosphate isomerase-like protein (cupin superfamily)